MSTNKYQIKEIPDHEGYFTDTNGKIFSALVQHGRGRCFIERDNLHEIKISSLPSGHQTCRVWVNGKPRTLRPQIAVAKTFLTNDNPKEKIYVCHKDGNPRNNNVDNLYWGTPTENTADMKKHGTMAIGFMLPQTKLNEKQIRLIKHLKNCLPKISQSKISNIFKVNQSVISRIWNGYARPDIII